MYRILPFAVLLFSAIPLPVLAQEAGLHLSVAHTSLSDPSEGEDPATAKQAEYRAGTFRELADLYLEKHAKKRKRSWRDDERLLNVELLPVLGTCRAKDVTRSEVLLLESRWM